MAQARRTKPLARTSFAGVPHTGARCRSTNFCSAPRSRSRSTPSATVAWLKQATVGTWPWSKAPRLGAVGPGREVDRLAVEHEPDRHDLARRAVGAAGRHVYLFGGAQRLDYLGRERHGGAPIAHFARRVVARDARNSLDERGGSRAIVDAFEGG